MFSHVYICIVGWSLQTRIIGHVMCTVWLMIPNVLPVMLLCALAMVIHINTFPWAINTDRVYILHV